MEEKTDNIDILEELANNEHIRWSNWQKYVHSKCIKNDDGSLTIPKEYVEHWEYEINTDYADLPENIKESDRREVRQILEKLNYSTLIAENKELKVNNKKLQDKCKELIFEKQELTSALLDSIPKDKIKAKIEEMDNIISQNEEIIFNGRYEHLHTLTEARIVKGEMQSLLGKE